MHRRYLSCTISRCAEFPHPFDPPKSQSPFPRRHPTGPGFSNPAAKRKKKNFLPYDSFKLKAIAKHRFQDVDPPDPESIPAREREISEKSSRIVNATPYKLLRDMIFSETIVEGSKGSRGLKDMLERHEARAMLNVQRPTELADLGLYDEENQGGVSFAPGTFIEARRFVFTFKKRNT